jgi:hypothetical protein
MIIIHGFGTAFGPPEINPFVIKSKIRLNMACRKQPAHRPTSPKGPLPRIDDGLGALQRALAWALERMIEHHVYWALAGARWFNPENFAKGLSRDQGH